MSWKGTIATLLKRAVVGMIIPVWMGGTFAGILAIKFGWAAPYVSRSLLPFASGNPFLVELFVVPASLPVGVLLVGNHRWYKSARAVGLERGGWIRGPDLVGTIDGREVRISRFTTDHESGSSSKFNYTLVETDLDRETEDALIGFVRLNERPKRLAELDEWEFPAPITAMEGIHVIGREALARDVLTRRVRTALLTPDVLDSVYAGNASALVPAARADARYLGKRIDIMLGRNRRFKVYGDTATVRSWTEEKVVDPETLRDQAEAVAALADAFERSSERRR